MQMIPRFIFTLSLVKMFLFSHIAFLNALLSHIRDAQNLRIFKPNLKTHYGFNYFVFQSVRFVFICLFYCVKCLEKLL